MTNHALWKWATADEETFKNCMYYFKLNNCCEILKDKKEPHFKIYEILLSVKSWKTSIYIALSISQSCLIGRSDWSEISDEELSTFISE